MIIAQIQAVLKDGTIIVIHDKPTEFHSGDEAILRIKFDTDRSSSSLDGSLEGGLDPVKGDDIKNLIRTLVFNDALTEEQDTLLMEVLDL